MALDRPCQSLPVPTCRFQPQEFEYLVPRAGVSHGVHHVLRRHPKPLEGTARPGRPKVSDVEILFVRDGADAAVRLCPGAHTEYAADGHEGSDVGCMNRPLQFHSGPRGTPASRSYAGGPAGEHVIELDSETPGEGSQARIVAAPRHEAQSAAELGDGGDGRVGDRGAPVVSRWTCRTTRPSLVPLRNHAAWPRPSDVSAAR